MPIKWLSVLSHGCQRTSIHGYVWQEVHQILYEAQKPLYLIIISRFFPLLNSGHLIAISMKAFLINDMSKTLYPFSVELTFFLLKEKFMLMNFINTSFKWR
jgi:hypothetical protein